MRRALLPAALAFSTMPAHAQDADLAANVQALIDTAIAEQTVFINCTATEPETGRIVSESWEHDIQQVLPLLPRAGLGRDAIAAFEKRADPATILMSDRPFKEVVALCSAEPDWIQRYYRLNYVLLPMRVQQLLDGKAP